MVVPFFLLVTVLLVQTITSMGSDLCVSLTKQSGSGSSVGTATGYGLDGPGIESRCGREIFRTCPDRPWLPPSLLYNGYRVFPGVNP